MRQRLALILALSVAWAIGCAPAGAVRSTSWLPHRPFFQGPIGSDVVRMRIAVLECPPGEAEWRYLTGELWQRTDESLIEEDRRQAMTESGFRVGKVGPQPPAKLLSLLTSTRYNPAPRELTFRTGEPEGLGLGPTLAHCRYRAGADAEPIDLERADCKLVVVASRAPDGKTLLRLTPEVEHGEAKRVYGVDALAGSFTSLPERPTETYPRMAWEAELAPNEYLIVGGSFERTESLGHQFFVRPDEPRPVQRLLVVQMGAAPSPEPPGTKGKDRTVPVAMQAARQGLGVRGAAP